MDTRASDAAGVPTGAPDRRTDAPETKGSGDIDGVSVGDEGEHLKRDLARVRAKFAMDGAAPRRALSEAWTSPTDTREDDEAEFVDVLADCLGAGLSLDSALSCWDTGTLVCDADEETTATGEELAALTSGEQPRRTPTGARRVLVR